MSSNYIFTATSKYKILVKRLKKIITKALKYIIEGLVYSEFDIQGTEVEFSNKGKYKPIILNLEDGKKVEITGKIDRIDTAQNEDGKYLRIIDYKSSAKNIDLNEVYAGLQIQLLTYLDAVCKQEDLMPAGILYFSLLEQMVKSDKKITEEEIENEIRKNFKMKGLIVADVKIIKLHDKILETGSSKIVPAAITSSGEVNKKWTSGVSKEEFKVLQDDIQKIIKDIAKEILSGKIVSIIFCCCYLIQWIIYPIQLFAGSLNENTITQNQFRMRMPGSICAFTLFFYGINQFLLNRKKINILYIGLGFLVFLIMGFRTLLAFTLLFTLFLLYSITKNAIRIIGYLILGCILVFGISQTEFAQSKIKEMQTRQEKGDNFSNKDYIRYREYEYFTEEQFIKPGEKFIGGGTPVYDGNNYANTLDHVAITYGYFWVDLGLIGLSWIIGIPAVLILIYIIIRCSIRIKDKDILFIRYTLLTTLFSSLLTTAEIFRRGNFIIIALFLCVEYTRSLEKKKHSLNNTYYDKKFGN